MTARTTKSLIWIAVLVGAAGVFVLYLQPEMLRTMADQLWTCF